VGTHVDVIEQRRAQKALDETKRFLDAIIESIPFFVVVKDARSRKYILVNRALEAMIQMPQRNILGKTAFDYPVPKSSRTIVMRSR
jgi:nitrogen fixation/metabolism regulation signal transduction histidine kinase